MPILARWAVCCARAESCHATAALLSSVMNSRRFIQSPYREDEADSQAFRNPGLINVELHWLFFWWQRAQIRDDSVQVAISHARVPREPHRRLQAATILTDALGDGSFDLGITPRTDSLLLVRSDVPRHRLTERTAKCLTALGE